MRCPVLRCAAWLCLVYPALATGAFVNWENAHVHPLDGVVDGGQLTRLLAVNTPDNRLEVYDVFGDALVHRGSVAVGLDPVSVRVRSAAEAWVVNHISDSISIVDLASLRVVATLNTDDEPADVVFAGTPQRAFVSCSQSNTVLVFDPSDLTSAPIRLAIEGEDPRAMTVNTAGDTVFVAVFESGNNSTVLGGGSGMGGGFPPNVVNHPSGPYGGTNPPPNDGANFNPPQKAGNPPPPAVGLIVKKDASGNWMDDNNGDWTPLVSGAGAGLSGRPVGWDLLDHDVAVIDASTLGIQYITGLMNICMAIAYNDGTDEVTVVGTDATNEIRFEPVLNGRFLRVNIARVDASAGTALSIDDLNDHLTYANTVAFTPIAQVERDKSIGDPRAIVWNSAGTRGYIAGMGSDNLVVIDALGARAGTNPTIEVGEGPTGLVLDETSDRLYVLNKFDGSISIVDTVAESQIAQVSYFDPSPAAIKVGRKHLYSTHRNSGLGHIACASCHVDARMDRLPWDLGDPAGDVKTFNQNCPDGGCQDWHPMKGPMLTQTLQDIIGNEPHHWRGDRNGIEEFAGAFAGLQGDDAPLPPGDMQEFENFLATIHFPPNPFRNFDNTLPTNLPLPGHFTTGRFGPAGAPLPNGDATQGLLDYRTANLDGVECVTCHTLPTGMGPDGTFVGPVFQPIPPGPNGEHHLALVSVDGSTNVSMKIPHLRNLYERVGFDTTQVRNVAGAGFLHDGSVDSIARFVNEPVFSLTSDQQTADMVAFMLAFSGSDLPVGSPTNFLEPPGPDSQDTHAAVGAQTTLIDESTAAAGQLTLIGDMIALADTGAVGLVVKGKQGGIDRGYSYLGGGTFQSDRSAETIAATTLQASATNGFELTYTVVPTGCQTRIGIDRDSDGALDRDELDACSNPADAASVPPGPAPNGDADHDNDVDKADFAAFSICAQGPGAGADGACICAFDFDASGHVDLADYGRMQDLFTGP